MLTKAEEIANFQGLIASCPAGYVREILEAIAPDIERAVRSDFTFIPFREMYQEQQAWVAAAADARKQITTLQREISELETTKSFLQQGLSTVRETVKRLANL